MNVAAISSSIGMVYHAWGKYDEAKGRYRAALKLAEQLGAQDQVASNLRLIGSAHQALREFEQAVQHYEMSLRISRELGRPADIPATLDSLGTAYFEWGRPEEAIDYYRQALAAAEQIGKRDQIARDLIHIGGVYQVWGKHELALETYLQALAAAREAGVQADVATCLNNLGTLYMNLEDYGNAADYFHQAIEIKESLRLTAKGDIRRDFLASWISSYRWLIMTYVNDRKPESAFDAIELVAARYLAEQLNKKSSAAALSFSGIRSHREKLAPGAAIIDYANIGWQYPVLAYADRETVLALRLAIQDFERLSTRSHGAQIRAAADALRGLAIAATAESEKEQIAEQTDLADIVNYYRRLISRPSLTPDELPALESIGRNLYQFLIAPVASYLADKDELIIVPDGILAFLPFEALVMPDGQYLVEKYNVKYAQSLAVSELLAGRSYSSAKKPLLAFGGAVYDEISYEGETLVSEKQLELLAKQTRESVAEGQSTRGIYGTLGITSWQNLPGTLTEVEAIGRIVEKSQIFTGAEVTESNVKRMSGEGVLREYNVLHFATHGLVVPAIPELSALVLSQFAEEQQSEDGYLNMKEISELALEADFVNLSACETGLGKIYGGEGVVGLTQSFLIAGANGLSVSLWQVADESIMEFMTGMYRLVQEEGLSYDRAMTEMKRRFIKGKYSNPFYWAPFVYYGN